jgi:hypothetical protein
MNHRMIPPAGGATLTIYGRSYICSAGSAIDVPDFDGQTLEANGWLRAAYGGAGTTDNRPANPVKSLQFLDTTLGFIIVHNGVNWVNPATGATV